MQEDDTILAFAGLLVELTGGYQAPPMSEASISPALEHALWTRASGGVDDLAGLIHHHDAGSQYTSIAFTQRLLDAGVDASVGSVGDA
jgi:putative transposase